MKLVIEIPEETYDEVRHYGLNLCPRDREALEKAFKTCKPLPKDITNGDIIKGIFKTMFPRFEIYENRDNEDYPYVDVIVTEHDSNCYPKKWWNAPYKADKEN